MKRYQVKEDEEIPSIEDIERQIYSGYPYKPEALKKAMEFDQRLENGGSSEIIWREIEDICTLCSKYNHFPNPLEHLKCPLWSRKNKAYERSNKLFL